MIIIRSFSFAFYTNEAKDKIHENLNNNNWGKLSSKNTKFGMQINVHDYKY